MDEYVRRLYELSEHANFPDKEETIRDRLVLGLLNTEVSEKLQLQIEPPLTLELAIRIAKNKEVVSKQIQEQRHVDAVKTPRSKQTHGSRGPGGGGGPGRSGHATPPKQDEKGQCKFCGLSHARRQCPAYGKVCYNCQTKNHFAVVECVSEALKNL